MKGNVYLKLIAVIMVMVFLFTMIPANVIAEVAQTTEEEYIQSVKLAQASNREEAEKLLKAAGYTLVEGNLNEGTGHKGVWLGIKTTNNPEEAIYDMKLMNMKGGFTLTSMEKALETQRDSFQEMATDLFYLIFEFVEAYEAGSVPAQKAYKALNFFRMVDKETELKEENGLGYQLVNGGISTEELINILLLCDSALVDSVIKILTMGIQLRSGNWMQKLSELGPYDSEKVYCEEDDEAELKRRAQQMLEVLQLYSNAYNGMEAIGLVSGEFDDNGNTVNAEYTAGEELTAEETSAKKLDESRYKIYKIVFDEMAKYQYGVQTLKDFFCSLADEGNAKALYPLASILSDGEFAALSYGCFLEIATGATAKEEDFENYDAVYASVTKEAQSVYLYAGVNELMLQEDSVIGFTDAATRHMASTGEMEFYEKETWAEDAWETGKHVATIVGAVGMATMGLAKLTMGITMFVSVASTTAAASLKSGVLAGVMKFCAAISGMSAMVITAVVVAAIVLITLIITVINKAINDSINWDKNPIPEYLYDVQEVSFSQTSENEGIATEFIKRPVFVFYEGVRDVNGDVLDLNAYSDDATQWVSLYVSYDRQGTNAKPIQAKDLLVKTGNGETPEGCVPLSRFGEVVAYNLNQWEDTDDVNGVYMFYKQDKEVAVESDRTYYIYDVYLQQGESDAHCKQLLEAAGFTPLNVNLSPDLTDGEFVHEDRIYTYLGYKLTTNSASAITDLRMVYGPNQGEVRLGAATYAECGSNGSVTLYATKYKSAGTPLLAGGLICVDDRYDAPSGYEPVNFFGGGPAISFNVTPEGMGFDTKDTYLYFLPSTTFTGGTAYLGGLSYFHITYTTLGMMTSTNKERPPMVLSYLKEKLGQGYTPANNDQAVIDYTRVRTGYTKSLANDGSLQDAVAYYETFNPYRAIYQMKATTVKQSSNNFMFEGTGFVQWNRTQFVPNNPSYQESYDYFFSYNEQSQFDTININGKLYVTGNPNGNNEHDTTKDVKNHMTKVQPIQVKDFECITKKSGKQPSESMKPITDVFSESQQPVYLTNTKASHEFAFYMVMDVIEKPYVSSISAIDELTLFRSAGGADEGLKRIHITDDMMLAQLAAAGATNFCDYRPQMLQPYGDYGFEMNALKFGYTRSKKEGEALTDIFFYFNGFSTDSPPKTLYRQSTKYNLICEIPYNLTGYDGAPKPGVYVYGTTDDDVGTPIIDFTVSDYPFKDGYETVRTMNGRSLFAEIRDYAQRQKDSHNELSYGNAVYGDLVNFFKFAENSQLQENGPFYFHIKRQGDNLRLQKPYVEKLYVASGNGKQAGAYDSLFDQGAEACLQTDLNEDAGGAYVYLGYSYTADPTKAIKEIRAYHQKNPPATLTDGSNRKFNLVSSLDINKDAGGDYIYLYATKESATANPISGLKVLYKVSGTGDSTQTLADGRVVSVNTQCTKMWDSSKDSDLNRWASGEYIYLMYTATKNATKGSYVAPNYGKDKTYERKAITGMTEKGKYIGAVYVMDKNTIRQEKLAAGVASSACTCEKITDQEVFDRLKTMGATTIIQTPILLTSSNYYAKNNKNKVFIGYSRTDTKSKGIRKLAINTQILSLAQPPESMDAGGLNYKLVAPSSPKVKQLPRAISLIGLEDKQDMLVPRMYLYTTTEGGGEPIRDISIGTKPIQNGWTNVRSGNGVDPFVDVANLAEAESEQARKDFDNSGYSQTVYSLPLGRWMEEVAKTFDQGEEKVTPFFIHYKNYDEASYEQSKPYIGEVFLAQGDSKIEALANLAEFEPDGFIDRDLNEEAGGKWVYLGYKRVADKEDAITDFAIHQGKNPEKVRLIDISDKVSVKYDLVANIDLNAKAGGKYLYLYSTKSQNVGGPILDISISESVVSTIKCGIEQVTVKRIDGKVFTDETIDLNKGAGGKYLYMVMKRETTGGHVHLKLSSTKDVPATCGKDGSLTWFYTCLDCGASVEKLIKVYPATGNHTDAVDDGNHKCDVCGKKDVSAHVNGTPEKEDITEPTCVKKGSYHAVMYCTECNKVLRDTEIPIDINPNNHKDGPDKNHDCDWCGALNIEEHTPGEPKEENRIASTTDADGSYKLVVYCSECGEKLSEETVVIPAVSANPASDHVGSIVGNGSLLVIGLISGLGIITALILFFKKRREIIE